MTVRALLGIVAIAVLASPADAQWEIDRGGGVGLAVGAGRARQIYVGVGCQGPDQVVVLSLPSSDIFHNGSVEARWNDGTVDRYAFQDQNATLRGPASDPRVREMIGKLRRLNSVTLRATRWRDEPVSDTVSLSGSSRAIGSLPCATSARTTRPRREATRRTAASMKRPGMALARSVAESIQGGLDTPMSRILPQMPDDVSPSRSRSGDLRIFTYRFRDGSRLILAAQPQGGGRGLALYYVDIED